MAGSPERSPLQRLGYRNPWLWLIPLVVALFLGLLAVSRVGENRLIDATARTSSTTTSEAPQATEAPAALASLVPVACRARPEAVTAECYDAYLPASPTATADELVVIHVAVVPGAADAPDDPVLMLHGGPAVPMMADFLPRVGDGFQQMYGNRDVILFDQRGTGLAAPRLDCPLDETYHDSLSRGTRESSLEWLARKARPCMTNVADADLADYTPAAIAADAATIVEMLGYESVNLFGSSFGSRIAITYAAAEPTAVRSMVLEGPYPPNIDGVARRGEAAMAGLQALFAACRDDAACGAAYPDLEATLSAIVTRLDEVPVILAGGEIINGRRFMEVVYRSGYSSTGLQRIPRLIADTDGGDLAVLREQLDATASTAEGIDAVAYFATICATTSPSSEAALSATVATLPAGVADYFADLGGATLDLCRSLNLMGSGSFVGPTDVPTLYLVGRFDPVTPPAWTHEGAEGSWPGAIAEFSYGTHANLFEEACAPQFVAEFVATLSSSPPPCLGDQVQIDFDL